MTRFLGGRQHTAFRFAPGAYVEGDWVPGESTEFSVYGSLQPMTPDTLQQLPEGWRARAEFKLYTNTALQTVEESQEPDQVEVKGIRYEVHQLTDFHPHRLAHGKYVLVKPERRPNELTTATQSLLTAGMRGVSG